MTTLAALVAAAPASTAGVPVAIGYAGGGWRIVFELADPGAGSAVEWFDVTCEVAGWLYERGADQYAGRYRASVANLDLYGDDDTFAPWNPDTTAVFGVNVPLGAGLLLRGGFIRVAAGTVVDWLPRFTNRIERWGDATYGKGLVRRFPIVARDLLTALVNVPIPASSEQNWSERVDYILTQAGWPFGWTIYGATFDTGVDVLTLPARPAASSAINELDATLDPAGLCYYTDRTGRLIIRPTVWDTFHTDAFTAGADGTPLGDVSPVTFHYLAEDDIGGVLGYAAYIYDVADPFGFGEAEDAVINHVRIVGPGGTFDDDDPVSIQRHDRKPYQAIWIADNDQVAGDLLAYRSDAIREAAPLSTTVDHHGFMGGPARLDYLGYVAVDHQTAPGRPAVFGNGWVRQYTERGTPRGAPDDTSWALSFIVDIFNIEVTDTLLPVEDLTVVDVTDTSAQFSWTNPTQIIEPTNTQVRVLNPASLWATVAYPSTGIIWGALEPSTDYEFQVRLIRVVDGITTHVSTSRQVEFTTDPTTVPNIIDVGDDGDTDVEFPPPAEGCDTIDWELQVSATGTGGWTMVHSGTLTDEPWEVTIPDVVYDGTKFYRVVADACGDVTVSNLFVGECTDPAILGGAPFDDADLVFYFPAVCPPDILVDAISEDPATKGYCFDLFTTDGDGNVVLVADGEGIVAYGPNPTMDFTPTIAGLTGDTTIACKVQLASQPDADVILFAAAGLYLVAVADGANWSLEFRAHEATPNLIVTSSGTQILDFGQWYDLAITHDATSGDMLLYVDGNEDGSVAGLGERVNPGAWGVSLSDNGLITNCAVWARVLAPAELPGFVPAPTVTIDKAAGQADPAATGSPILFTVVFSEAVTGFTTGDVTLSGSALATTTVVSGTGPTYTVTVTGMTLTGTVVATIAAGVATSVATSQPNQASTSTDNSVAIAAGAGHPGVAAWVAANLANVLAYYKLDDNKVVGTLNDYSGNAHHGGYGGTRTDGTLDGQTVLNTNGGAGNASIAYGSWMNSQVGGFAVVQFSLTSRNQSIVSRDAGSSPRDYQWRRTSGATGTNEFIKIVGGVTSVTGGAMTTGTRYTVGWYWDGTNTRLYINGVQVGSTTAMGDPTNSTSPMVIADWTAGAPDQTLSGLIGSVVILGGGGTASMAALHNAWMSGYP